MVRCTSRRVSLGLAAFWARGGAAAAGEGLCAEAVGDALAGIDDALSLKVALLQQRARQTPKVKDEKAKVEEAPKVKNKKTREEVQDLIDMYRWHSVDECRKECRDKEGCKYALLCGSKCHLKEDASLTADAPTIHNSKCTAFGNWVPTCAAYKCPKENVSANLCQCTEDCLQRGNCCADYHDACLGPKVEPAHPRRKRRGRKVFGHPNASLKYPVYEGFTLWLAEEFSQPLDLDTDPIWTWSDGGLAEGRVRFAKEAIRFENGTMKIYATEGNPSKAVACSHAEVGNVGKKPLTSGEFRTKYNMFRFGRYETRMMAPSPQEGKPLVDGNFISSMFVYRDAKFKHWREIDIEVTGESIHSVTTNVLSADDLSVWSPGIQSSTNKQYKQIDVRSEFHIYAFEWLPTSVTWFIDGEKVRTFTSGRLKVPDLSVKVMMNLWISSEDGGFGGKEGHNNRYPMHSEYDYFRFYKWDNETEYPCPQMNASCLTEDDRYLAGNNPKDNIEQEGTLPWSSSRPCNASYGALPFP